MTRTHEHGHAHAHGPLDAITHVHGGPMVLDIGGSVGALHVVVDETWVGDELFLATADPSFSVHTGVWRREAGSGATTTALFPALEEGVYRVIGRDGHELDRVEVRGGEVTLVDVAARAGTVR